MELRVSTRARRWCWVCHQTVSALRFGTNGHVSGSATMATKVAEAMVRKVATVHTHTPASQLTEVFERGEVALITDDAGVLQGILTKLDLIEVLSKRS